MGYLQKVRNSTIERLKFINPTLAYHVGRLITQLESEGFIVEVVQGFRSYTEQQALYDQGRTKPGNIVTKCRPGNSWHNFGLAVDLAPFVKGIPDWNLSHPVWKRMHEVALSMNFTCGSDFRTFPDNPHFQMTGRFGVNPDDEVRQLFVDGGVAAVWAEAGLK